MIIFCDDWAADEKKTSIYIFNAKGFFTWTERSFLSRIKQDLKTENMFAMGLFFAPTHAHTQYRPLSGPSASC